MKGGERGRKPERKEEREEEEDIMRTKRGGGSWLKAKNIRQASRRGKFWPIFKHVAQSNVTLPPPSCATHSVTRTKPTDNFHLKNTSHHDVTTHK